MDSLFKVRSTKSAKAMQEATEEKRARFPDLRDMLDDLGVQNGANATTAAVDAAVDWLDLEGQQGISDTIERDRQDIVLEHTIHETAGDSTYDSEGDDDHEGNERDCGSPEELQRCLDCLDGFATVTDNLLVSHHVREIREEIARTFRVGKGAENEETVFGVCGAMDIMLATRYFSRMPVAFDRPYLFGRGNVSFNPKGKDFMCMSPVIRSLPYVRHVFMYRDVRELYRRMLLGWTPPWNRPLELPPPEMTGRPQPIFSQTMAQVRASGGMVEPSMPLARRVCMGWMECMCIWQELTEDDATAEGTRLCIRMADYTRKDPEVVRRVLGFVVCHRGDVGDGVVSEAMEAFETHSQKGDKMSTSSFNPASRKPRLLSPKDIEEITALARAVPSIGSPDYMHPDSMWATAGSPLS